MSERPSQPGEDSVGGMVEGIQTTFTTRELVYPSIIAFLAWVVCVYDYIMFGTLLPKMAGDFGWATATSTLIATIVSIGTFFVAIFVRPMIDYVGRKRSLIITTAGTGLSSLLTGLTPGVFSAPYLAVIRAISGLGYSEQAVNTTYLNELYGNRKSRGFIYAFIQGGWPIGVLLASAFTALLLGPAGWRGVFMLATIPALTVAVLALRLKESPRFLAMQRVRQFEKEGRHEEAVEFGRHFDIDVHHVQETTLQQIFEPDIRRLGDIRSRLLAHAVRAEFQYLRADDVHDRTLLHNRTLRGPVVLHGRVVPNQGARHGRLVRERDGPDRGDRRRGFAYRVPQLERGEHGALRLPQRRCGDHPLRALNAGHPERDRPARGRVGGGFYRYVR